MLELMRVVRSQRGQSLVELTLSMPILLLLSLGAIEFSNIIHSYLVLTHLTREGANLTSRSTDPIEALDAIITAAGPTVRVNNSNQWRVIYSQIVPDPNNPLDVQKYKIKRNANWVRGNFSKPSEIGNDGAYAIAKIPSFTGIDPGRTLHVVEVFYDYGSGTITPLENFAPGVIPKTFYTRTIFMDVG